MYVVFVSIDKPARWSQWHSSDTDSVYYSEFYKYKKDVDNFINTVKEDYPDSNLIDGKCGHEYYIKHVTLIYDSNDTEGFGTLCSMMGAYNSYEKRRK